MPDRLYHVEEDWYEWRQRPALSAHIYVRVVPHDDGRLALAELRIVGEPTSDLLRSIPVGRIEAAANAQLAVLDDADAPRSPRARRRAGAVTGNGGAGRRADDEDGWVVLGDISQVRRRRSGDESSGRGRPDRFYEDIARSYQRLSRSSRRPAADLAEQHGVPVTTAHRWIKEARRRGILPAGRPGKAG